jgi:hypothetical protein
MAHSQERTHVCFPPAEGCVAMRQKVPRQCDPQAPILSPCLLVPAEPPLGLPKMICASKRSVPLSAAVHIEST